MMNKDVKLGLIVCGLFVAALAAYLVLGRAETPVDEWSVDDGPADQLEVVDVLPRPGPGGAAEAEQTRPLPPGNDAEHALTFPFEAPARDAGDPFEPFEPEPIASADDLLDAASVGQPAGRQVSRDWARILETGRIEPGNELAGPRGPTTGATTRSTTPEEQAVSRPRIPLDVPMEYLNPAGPSDRVVVIASSLDEQEAAARGARGASADTAVHSTYTVQDNQTLSAIAYEVYGSARHWPRIAEANPQINPDRLMPGTELKLPELAVRESNRQTRGAAASRPADDGNVYRVQEGDSLYIISQRLYGTGGRVEELHELNRETIGPDPARLRIGMVLRLP